MEYGVSARLAEDVLLSSLPSTTLLQFPYSSRHASHLSLMSPFKPNVSFLLDPISTNGTQSVLVRL